MRSTGKAKVRRAKRWRGNDTTGEVPQRRSNVSSRQAASRSDGRRKGKTWHRKTEHGTAADMIRNEGRCIGNELAWTGAELHISAKEWHVDDMIGIAMEGYGIVPTGCEASREGRATTRSDLNCEGKAWYRFDGKGNAKVRRGIGVPRRELQWYGAVAHRHDSLRDAVA